MSVATKSRVPTARLVAEAALARVFDDDAFASAALEAELVRAPQLDARERALATELCYGTLRVLPWLEAKLDKHAKKSVTKQRPRVRASLAIASYQICFLDRIPPYAAVNEAVVAIRAASDARVAGFANAILRKVAASVSPERPSLTLALRASVPPWLGRALERSIGKEGRDQMIDLGASSPPLGLVVPHAEERNAILERLRAVAPPEAVLEPGQVSPLAIVARGAGRIDELLPGESVSIQEEGSQLVALALGAKAGERVLDACAGRGHKTRLLGFRVGAGGTVDAADLHPFKLDRIATPSGGPSSTTYAVDWTAGSGDVPAGYDAVLVDAPCSGSGTLRRRPDLLLRRSETGLAELQALQRAILERASSHVRVGGRLVYAVCSVLREEAEDVLAAAALDAHGFRPAPFASDEARAIFGDATMGRLLPHVHGTDGYFLASFVRTAP